MIENLNKADHEKLSGKAKLMNKSETQKLKKLDDGSWTIPRTSKLLMPK